MRYILTLIACFTLIIPVHAQGMKILENYRVDMPEIPVMSDADFEKQTRLITVNPQNREDLAFEMHVPKEWEQAKSMDFANQIVSKNMLGNLVELVSPGSIYGRGKLTVEAIKMDYEMSVEHWSFRYLLSRGLPSKGFKVHNRNRAEFFYVDIDKDQTYAVRALAQRNGNTVLLATYQMPMEKAKDHASLQAAVLDSFKITNPDYKDPETMIEYRFLDLASVKYPESWTLRTGKARSMDRMDVQFLNFNKNSAERQSRLGLDGKINVNLMYYTAMKGLINEYSDAREKILGEDLQIADNLSVSEFVIINDLKSNLPDLTAYDLKGFTVSHKKSDKMKFELWMTTLEIADYYYIFSLLTPSRDEDFFTWTKNIETYNLIMKSIQPNLDLLIYED